MAKIDNPIRSLVKLLAKALEEQAWKDSIPFTPLVEVSSAVHKAELP